ncbi:MAG: hypothetical protein RLZZ253_362, partial [Verrucomicrobiota bacterium]
ARSFAHEHHFIFSPRRRGDGRPQKPGGGGAGERGVRAIYLQGGQDGGQRFGKHSGAGEANRKEKRALTIDFRGSPTEVCRANLPPRIGPKITHGITHGITQRLFRWDHERLCQNIPIHPQTPLEESSAHLGSFQIVWGKNPRSRCKRAALPLS